MSGDEDGFAEGDVRAALMIPAITIVRFLRAVETAGHAALAADETCRATALLNSFSDSGALPA